MQLSLVLHLFTLAVALSTVPTLPHSSSPYTPAVLPAITAWVCFDFNLLLVSLSLVIPTECGQHGLFKPQNFQPPFSQSHSIIAIFTTFKPFNTKIITLIAYRHPYLARLSGTYFHKLCK